MKRYCLCMTKMMNMMIVFIDVLKNGLEIIIKKRRSTSKTNARSFQIFIRRFPPHPRCCPTMSDLPFPESAIHRKRGEVNVYTNNIHKTPGHLIVRR